jgi:hypothetical protein
VNREGTLEDAEVLVVGVDVVREGGGWGARAAPHPPGDRVVGSAYCSLTTTFVRSIWFRRLALKLSLTESFSRFGYVYQ